MNEQDAFSNWVWYDPYVSMIDPKNNNPFLNHFYRNTPFSDNFLQSWFNGNSLWVKNGHKRNLLYYYGYHIGSGDLIYAPRGVRPHLRSDEAYDYTRVKTIFLTGTENEIGTLKISSVYSHLRKFYSLTHMLEHIFSSREHWYSRMDDNRMSELSFTSKDRHFFYYLSWLGFGGLLRERHNPSPVQIGLIKSIL